MSTETLKSHARRFECDVTIPDDVPEDSRRWMARRTAGLAMQILGHGSFSVTIDADPAVMARLKSRDWDEYFILPAIFRERANYA